MSNEYYLTQLNKLVKGTITSTITDGEDEFFGLEVKLPDGKRKTLWFLQDDEGNGPGSFEIGDI